MEPIVDKVVNFFKTMRAREWIIALVALIVGHIL